MSLNPSLRSKFTSWTPPLHLPLGRSRRRDKPDSGVAENVFPPGRLSCASAETDRASSALGQSPKGEGFSYTECRAEKPESQTYQWG
jgi:hypothetical protein